MTDPDSKTEAEPDAEPEARPPARRRFDGERSPIPKWIFLIVGGLPIIVTGLYFTLKPAPDTVPRVRPGPHIPLERGHILEEPATPTTEAAPQRDKDAAAEEIEAP